MPPDLVVFDCDGVLVDSERLVLAVEARILTDLGWPHTPEEVADRWMGRTSAAQLAELEEHLGPANTLLFEECSTRESHAAFERHLVAVPGIEGVLDALDDTGTLTCVASSGSHAKMERTLGRTGLYDRFRGRIFSAEEVAHGKPAPDLFLHAATALGAEPAACAVVEDSVYGVQAGVAAGMTVYGFGGGLTAAETLAGAGAITFEAMTDLRDVIAPARPDQRLR